MALKQRYLMLVSYMGTDFWGSQLQIYEGSGATRKTVQYVLENGLRHVFRLTEERPFCVHLASRTDRGVHALRAALHVDLPEFKRGFIKPDILKHLLNRYFADLENVSILEVYTVPDTFHVREAVLDKTYMYRYGILKEEFYKRGTKFPLPVTEVNRTYLHALDHEFDLRRVKEAAALFEGKKDFGAITGRPTHNTRPTVCNILTFTVEPAQPLLSFDTMAERYNYYIFTCRGDRFLYHMVRRMVSLALAVGFNIVTLKDIQKLFDEPVYASWPRRFINVVPGCGLYLANINIDLQKLNDHTNAVTVNKSEETPLAAES